MNVFSRITHYGAAGAVAAVLSVGAANAATITSTIMGDPTLASLAAAGFTPIDLGTSTSAGAVGAASPIAIPGGLASFTGASGVYAGDVSGVTRAPIRNASGGADLDPGPGVSYLNYFNARANSGSVILTFGTARTSLELLWGSVDPNPTTYNQLTFNFGGGNIINGADVVAATSGTVISGTTNLLVKISDLAPFTMVTVTATNEAFEFTLAKAVPEPATLALFGAGLLGLGFIRRRG